MNDAQVERFFSVLKAANPQPQTELQYGSVFELLVAVLLSAQATDASVNKATPRLFALAPTPQAMLARIFHELKVGSLVPRRVVIGISPPMPTEDCRCQSVRMIGSNSAGLADA